MLHSQQSDVSVDPADTYPSSTATTSSLLLVLGHFLGSLCEGEQVLGLLHVQSSLLQELLLFLGLSASLLFLVRFKSDKPTS